MAKPTRPQDAGAIRRIVDSQDVHVVFQPVVDLRTRRVFAYEALARTRSSEFDGPMAMFAAAVEAGVTGRLGRMIRAQSVAGCTTHPLFLNIHPAELNERYVVQPDDPIFQHSEDVYLEITEAVPLSHFQLCQNMLSELRGRGVFLVVDDLGAGYSNLKYIADLNPRIVKLDRILIAGLTRDSRLHRLVTSIVRMCTELDAHVVAEGIETEDELDAVVASGAQFGQGFLLARPAFPPPAPVWPDRTGRRERGATGRFRNRDRISRT